MLACSTSWNSHRHTDGGEMMAELLKLGFEHIELGHGLRISQLEGILQFVERGDVQITSVHNFCPMPVEVMADSPDCYEYTSHRESDRNRAIKLTRETIQLAARVGAKAVVVHGGRIRALPMHRELMKLVREKKLLTKEYARQKLQDVLAREKAVPLYLERLVAALTPLLALAAEQNVHLGLENRERYEDVPSEREILPLLAKFSSPYLGYWHDFGHAQIKANLALLDHAGWLQLAGNRVFGCHLHDVIFPNKDHQPPFTGEIDYDELIPLVPAGCPMILEMHPDTPAEAIQTAAAKWRHRFGHS